jgi:hypothetical protein
MGIIRLVWALLKAIFTSSEALAAANLALRPNGVRARYPQVPADG